LVGEIGLLDSSYVKLRDWVGPDALRGGLRGIEREALRVDPDGKLAETPHPAELGSALTHPDLTTDYSESLLEFVTPPFPRTTETLRYLRELHAYVQKSLPRELLWPASMPCVAAADDAVPIADYGTSNQGMFRTVYRRGLGFRYGRAMQAIAGVHFNYSPRDALWPALREALQSEQALDHFRADRLMGLVRNYRRLAWVVSYLFGASPVIAKSFLPNGHAKLTELDAATWYAPHATSLRMSDLGYRNATQARLMISANSLDEYVRELQAAVTTVDADYAAIGIRVDGEYRQLNANILQIENEYYSSIRPKPGDRSLRPVAALRRDGIAYVEVRNLDIDPQSATGIGLQQMRIVELLLLYCLLSDSPPIDRNEQQQIDDRDLLVAWDGRQVGIKLSRGSGSVALGDWGLELADEFDALAELLGGGDYRLATQEMRAAFEDPGRAPSAHLIRTLVDQKISFLQFGVETAERHRRELVAMELSDLRLNELAAVASDSIAKTAQLEARDSIGFDEYLQQYFGS
jgi:glutamate--cysteine ligase